MPSTSERNSSMVVYEAAKQARIPINRFYKLSLPGDESEVDFGCGT